MLNTTTMNNNMAQMNQDLQRSLTIQTMPNIRNEITADGPLIHYRLDEAGTGTPTNYGSTGGVGTQTGNITRSQAGYNSDTGTSWLMNPASQATNISKGSITSGTAWTYEALVKRPNTTNPWVRIIANMRSSSNSENYWEIAVIDQNDGGPGGLRLYDSAAGSVMVNVPALSDLNWHHVAVVRRADNNVRFFVDGNFVGQGTLNPASRAGTFYVGDTRVVGTSYFIDEPAFYDKALSDARINARFVTTLTVAAPAMTGSGAMPDATVTAVDSTKQTLSTTLNKVEFAAFTGSTTLILTNNSVASYVLKTADPVLNQQAIVSAKLRVYLSSLGTSTVLSVLRNTQAFTESSTSAGPSVVNIGVTMRNLVVGWNEVDITSLVQDWANGVVPNHGIQLSRSSTQQAGVMSMDSRTSGRPPVIEMTMAPIVNTVNTTNPMAVSAGFGNTVVSVSSVHTAPSLTATVLLPDAIVTGTDGRLNVTALFPALSVQGAMPGGEFYTPDSNSTVTVPMTANLPQLNPQVVAGSSFVTAAPAMTADADAPAGSFTSVTDVIVTAGAFVSTFKWIVPYNADNDRYLNYVPQTIDSDDIWYKMEETGGTVAKDSATDASNFHITNGAYRGTPVFAVEGPQLRKAVRFPTNADYLEVLYPGDNTAINLFRNSEFTTELSFRTTQQNGELAEGLNLVNGQLVFDPLTSQGSNSPVRIAKNVADGQWHHMVISTPNNTGSGSQVLSDSRAYFVMIDGVIEYKRFAGGGVLVGLRAPRYLMRGIDGEMRDFVFRINYAVSEKTANKLYYEWSNATLIEADPIKATFDMGQGSIAKGNQKKMLVVYGLSTRTFVQPDGGQGQLGNYQSAFSGLQLRSRQGALGNFQSFPDGDFVVLTNPFRPAGGGIDFGFVHPFTYEGFTIYPVSIVGGLQRTGEIKSADGLMNNTYVDPISGRLVEDKTGLNRFIDLERDLIPDITEFDALTVFNYPAYAPVTSGGVTPGSEYPFSQANVLGANNVEWGTARDNLRNSILKAWSLGVSLWVNEPDMAQHLGIISAWDEHDNGEYLESNGNGLFNITGLQIDLAHGSPNMGTVGRTIDYVSLYQANIHRKIVATEPGLTDIASYEYGQMISGYKYDAFAAYSSWWAHDIINKKDGLRVGDVIQTSHYDRISNSIGTKGINNAKMLPRVVVYSARPQGIIGRVISKEVETYYGPNGTTVQNPWKDNVYTIVVDPGTTIRGYTGQGRIFVEFMDTDYTLNYLTSNRAMRGLGNGLTTWDFDTRRFKETQAQYVNTTISAISGVQNKFTSRNEVVQYNIISDEGSAFELSSHWTMNMRGLNWLKGAEEVEPGAVKIFAPSMNASIEGVAPTTKAQKSVVVNAPTMRATAAIVKPANFPDRDIDVRVLPMEAFAELLGLTNAIQATPMTATVSGGEPIVNTSGDRIRVYVDNNRNIQLFLKEDEY